MEMMHTLASFPLYKEDIDGLYNAKMNVRGVISNVGLLVLVSLFETLGLNVLHYDLHCLDDLWT